MQRNKSKIFNEKIDLTIQLFQKKLDRQTESLTILQTKVNYMLAFSSIVIVGYLAVLFDNKIDFTCSPSFKTLSILGLAGLLLTVILLLCAAWSRRFIDPPDPETIYSEYFFKTDLEELKNQIASDMKDSFIRNMKPLKSIVSWLNWAMWVFLASLIIIVLTALFLPQCAKIATMYEKSGTSSKPAPSNTPQRPVPPSTSPGTPISKTPSVPSHPVPPSQVPGTALPFGEGDIDSIK